MTKHKCTILYLVYALAAALVFLYCLFPEQAAIRRATGLFDRAYAPNRIHITKLRPLLPDGIRLQGVRILGEGNQNLQLTRVDIFPRLIRLMGGKLSLDYSGSAYGGSFSGHIEFGNTDGDAPRRMTLSMSKLQLRQLLKDRLADMPELGGTMDGEAVYHRSLKSAGLITGKLTLTGVTLVLPMLSGAASALSFSSVSTAFSMNPHLVSLNNTEFKGPQLEGTMTGDLHIGRALPQSRLDLTLKVVLHREYSNLLAQTLPVTIRNDRGNPGAYKFKLFGTLERPDISLLP
jgi:type II secretion system protein N